jgi:hypothetical protein
MIKIILAFVLSLTYIQASCKDYKLLGADKNNLFNINSKDTTIWDMKNNTWSVSKPTDKLDDSKCKSKGYILVNNNDYKYKTLLHPKNYYNVKKGWNYFTTPKDGVDVARTFSDAEFVYVYDPRSQAWAGYSPKKDLMEKIRSTRILELKYIEPKRGFYVLSDKAMRVGVMSKLPSKQCQKIMQNKNFDVIYDSGIDPEFSYNAIKSIALKSRNYSHTRKGVYNDSRIAIMTPKVKLSKDKKVYKYGPAIPRMMIHFNKAYQERDFYAYDFLEESCVKGYFPSKQKPPASVLKKLD